CKILVLAGAGQCVLQKLAPLRGFGGSVSVLSLSVDGRLLATGGGDGAIDLWDAATGKRLRKVPGHGKAIQAVTFSPDGSRLASGSTDGTVRLWQVGTGRLHHSLNGDRGDIRAVGVS